MADLLIRGMEMPESNLEYVSLWVYGDGRVYASNKASAAFSRRLQDLAVSLPKGHGRIVDAAEILEKANNSPWFDGDVAELGLLLGSEVTTIVPAEGGGEDG